jgi:hypothetical protein
VLYLLDASVLITAHRHYYPIDVVPEFWSWLQHMGLQQQIKMPLEIYEEIKDGRKDREKDLLFAWIQQADSRDAILLHEEPDVGLVRQVIEQGYAADLSDEEVEQLGRDPFLVAYALAVSDQRCVVTTEASRPSRRRQNRHLPDVCQTLGVKCCDTFALIRALGFRTSWRP